MNLDLLQNLDFKQNRFLRAAPQLLVTEPGTPILGELLVYDSTAPAAQAKRLAVYDSINEGSPFSTWRLLAGLNRNDQVTGLWTWGPPIRGGGVGTGAPFVLAGPTAFNPNPGTQLQNWVQHLNADYLDGRGAEEWADAAPSGLVIPVSSSTGQVRVNDPVKDFDAVNRRTLLATAAGLVVVAPCKVATTARLAGARSGNVITASANGVYAPDGVTLAISDRILLKDQEQGGTGIDNGIYTVTTLGTASVPVVLTRAADADATGELTVGTLVFISSGTVNSATQWSCQRPPGTGGGSIIAINSDIQLWQKTFGQSAYTEGRGIKFNGLEINFAQASDYTVGNLFYATAIRAMGPLANPTSPQFLHHMGAGGAPHWTSIQISDISDWPDPVVPVGIGHARRFTRFVSLTSIEDSSLEDFGTAPNYFVRAVANTVATPSVGLGDATHPFGFLWTSLLRLKPTAGASNVLTLLGVQNDLTDPNTDHKTVVTWGVSAVKTWLGFTPSDVGAVPSIRQLTFVGDTFVQVAAPAAQDLSADRTWNLTLNTAVLDTRWVTVATAQDITAVKRWKASSASTNLIELWTTPNAVPSLSITAGGSVQWGDGTVAPVGGIQLQNDRLSAYGKTWEFTSTSQVKFTSAITTTGAPTFVLGLDASDMVRRVNLSDLLTYTGVPLLTTNAVGYGDAGGRLAGDAANFRWDFTNKRLGLNVTPATTLHLAGQFQLDNTVASGMVTFAGGQVSCTDTSTNNADWNGRNFISWSVLAQKTGAATTTGIGTVESVRGLCYVTAGSISDAVGFRTFLKLGAASAGPAITNAYGFYSGFLAAAGTSGSIGTLTHFMVSSPSTMPQPVEQYGLRVIDLASVTGATRTAAVRLDITGPGVGERFNLYAAGSAPSYFAGSVGMGVILTPAVAAPPDQFKPSARLEFAIGTTVLAPIRFAATSALSSLYSGPLAGMLESRGDRLMFTDNVIAASPSRRPLAFYDDFGFTNDTGGQPAGSVAFDITAHMVAPLDQVNIIGQGDFTIWARFRVPYALRGPSYDGICSVAGSFALAGTYTNATRIQIDGSSKISFQVSTTGSIGRTLVSPSNICVSHGGKVVDVVVVRKGTAVPVMYLNGVAQNAVEGTFGGPAFGWDLSIDSKYLHAGTDVTGTGSVPEIFRVALFNYGMSQVEVNELSRYGRVDVADKWGSLANLALANPGFETFSAGAPTGWTKGSNVGTADETVITAHGGTHSVRFTGGGSAGAQSSNWLRQDILTNEKRYNAKAWAQRVSGTGPLLLGSGFQLVASGYAVFGSISTAGTWTQFGGTGEAGGAFGNNYALTFAATLNDVWLIDDVVVQQAGAICDMDFGVGCGSVIPDRSGRYPGTMTGTFSTSFEHTVSTCPVEVTQGSGTLARGLRRYTQTVSAKDGDTVTVTHNLGTQNITVAVWNAAGASVACAVNRKAGPPATNPDNVVELGFALIGAPTPPGTTVNLLVVIIG